ncbi:cyclopropane-fatty-acyl-phospholipid synthase [Lysobacter xinjiangensis]|uniref:Cyclopropane-fatty-acyl-phospholipid synthase n=1 Tax=Cognatilysobacter xinjiangensis TaxID=546892 RepID=A0ABQ3C1L8_9GAMM|nr:cyclopropane fatty acyl phospholipid synthase [Lysobacter xinjiangensis]GGZ64673.1 cyclopropane-fatty-acyl-phospholipid synthase [Lysobacter xinjiangensis]
MALSPHAAEDVVARRPAPDRLRRRVAELLASAGVRLDGTAPTDLRVRDPRFFTEVLSRGSLGLGETYMDGAWETDDLDGLLTRLMRARLHERVHGLDAWWTVARATLLNMQSRRRARRVGRVHYDLGNDLFRAMLGERMVYSCGYWARAATLDEAQEAKLDLIARKLELAPGMKVLDIGCGWGEALKFMAERYGVSGVGVTISKEQAALARELCRGLPVEIRLQDYRELDGRYDRVFSIGMFEHVGLRNYRRYFDTVRRCLAPDGLTLLHTIGSNVSVRATDPWIGRYIFPNSMLPSAAQITQAFEGLFVMEDWHGFGPDYDRTLQAWRANIERAWPSLPARYDERFRRMWRFYLAASMAVFRTRQAQLWQLVLSPDGVPGGYAAVR